MTLKYKTLAEVLITPKVMNDSGMHEPIITEVNSLRVMDKDAGNLLPGMQGRLTPVSEHLYKNLRGYFRDFLPRDEDYKEMFDRFEYLLGLVYADLNRIEKLNGWFGPFGCFIWRTAHLHPDVFTQDKFASELATEGANWPPLKAGLFGGTLERAKTAKTNFDAFLRQIPRIP